MADIDWGGLSFERMKNPEGYKLRWWMCWYHHPGFAHVGQWSNFEAPSFVEAQKRWAPTLGCFLLARLVSVSQRASFHAPYALDETQPIPALDEDTIDG